MEMHRLSAWSSGSASPPKGTFRPPQDESNFYQMSNLKVSEKTKSAIIPEILLRRKQPPETNIRDKRYDSLIALEQMTQCNICLTRQQNPKMLTCQHTFCFNCCNILLQKTPNFIECPTCQQPTPTESVDDLPSNIYLNNMIALLTTTSSADSKDTKDPKEFQTKQNRNTPTKSCVTCRTVYQEQNINVCQHCKTDFCGVCFPQHADELVARYPNFVQQLEEHRRSLTDEQTAFEQHYAKIVQEIKNSVIKKIEELKKSEVAILKDVENLQKTGEMEIANISDKIVNLKASLTKQNEVKPLNKVGNYMDYHQQMSQILESISSLGTNYKQFDMATFSLNDPPLPRNGSENDANVLYEEISNSVSSSRSRLAAYYKNKAYSAKLVSSKFQKPAGVCFSPWEGNQLYVCNMRSIYVYDITDGRILARIEDDKMTNPQSIACNPATREMFVSDTFGSVVHVFSKDGAYLRALKPRLSNPHGIAVSKDGDVLLCDTGNDRVLVMDSSTGKVKKIIGVENDVTELSMPTDVSTDGKIIVVADVGNHRVKIFDAETFVRRKEIGSLGKLKGQFRSANAVFVDEAGIIIVGDSGNRRIQMFNSEGEWILSTGTEYKFFAISGVCANSKGDVLVTDYKNKSLVKF